MQFRKKDIQQTKRVCFRLKDAREAAGLTREALAEKLRMSMKHIEALEDCRFHDLPFSAVYQKKMISSYLTAIGMDPQSFVQQFVYEEVKSTPATSETPRQSARYAHLPNLPFFFRTAGIAAVILSVGLYLFLQVKHIVEPPVLVVHTPSQDMTTRDDVLTVTGQTDREAAVLVNGQAVVSNEDGSFEEHITLAEGVNTIILTAKKKHGKETRAVRHVVYKKDQALSVGPQTQTLY